MKSQSEKIIFKKKIKHPKDKEQFFMAKTISERCRQIKHHKNSFIKIKATL